MPQKKALIRSRRRPSQPPSVLRQNSSAGVLYIQFLVSLHWKIVPFCVTLNRALVCDTR